MGRPFCHPEERGLGSDEDPRYHTQPVALVCLWRSRRRISTAAIRGGWNVRSFASLRMTIRASPRPLSSWGALTGQSSRPVQPHPAGIVGLCGGSDEGSRLRQSEVGGTWDPSLRSGWQFARRLELCHP